MLRWSYRDARAAGERRSPQRRSLLLAGMTAATIMALSSPAAASSPSPTNASPAARPLPMVSFAPLVEKALPAVVSVLVIGETLVPAELKPGETPPAPERRPFRSGGSGVIVNSSLGLIGTNRHVVRDAVTISVRLQDGREAPAKLLGVDAGADIAVLKIDLPNLTEMPLGNSSDLRVGDFVIAIGNPFGLEGSASAGIISGLMRSDIGYDIYESFIQVDAAVNPGNSGGALVNLDGELVGITTAVGRQSGASVGIGFAIPVNMARRIGMQIYQHGRMRRGSLGLETRDISPSAATELGLPNRRGALITAVSPDSPAARAGIVPGSVISTINGEPIRNNSDYMAHFGSSAVGEELELGLLVKGTPKTVKLTVTDEIGEPRTASVAKSIHGLGGLVVNEIGPRSPLYGQVQGVVVKGMEPGTPAATSGLQAGDVITGVNQLNIMSANQIADLNRTDAPVERVKIMRDGIPYIVDLRR